MGVSVKPEDLLNYRDQHRTLHLTTAAPFFCALAALLAYLITLSPEVATGDSAELALQAFQLGVTHSPGYPTHTFLGAIAGWFFEDHSKATRVLSAVCTATAVYFLCVIAIRLTRDRFAGCVAALLFAFLPTIWQHAIVTEVYNVNVCVIAGALFLAIRWLDRPTRTSSLAVATVLGIAMGTSVANLLILPGFALLFQMNRPKRTADWALPIITFAIVTCVVLSWSYFRSKTIIPIGTSFIPNTPGGFLSYIAGVQYGSFTIPNLNFALWRIGDHLLHWGQSFLWIGLVLGIFGVKAMWQQSRVLFWPVFVMLAGNLGYFTFYPWVDYQDMVAVSYFIFCIWVAFGLSAALKTQILQGRQALQTILPIAIVLGSIVSGLRHYIPSTRETPVTGFVRSSFPTFPPDSAVIVNWYNYTALLYFQQVEAIRPDVTIVERSDELRFYKWGQAQNWVEFAERAIPKRRVLIDSSSVQLPIGYRTRPFERGWHEIVRNGKSP